MYICYIEMIRFSKLLVGTMFLAIAIASFGGAKVSAATASPAASGGVPLGAATFVQPPLRPVTQLAAPDFIQLEDLECGSDVDFEVSDIGGSIKDLLSSLVATYVICPAIGFMYNAVGLIVNSVIGPLLKVNPLLENGSPSASGKYLYSAWSVFRDLANIGLAFAVLLLIFSQATSYGLNAYGVRKLLPKIAVAALMINLSFIICAILIDVFNILGSSLGATIEAGISAAAQGDDVSIGDQMGLASIALVAIMAGAFPVLAVAALFLLPLVLLIILLLGIASMIFVIARQILIAFLVVASPVAIAAWLFPNTDRYFSKWMSTFIKLLAIYPVVSILQAMTLVFLLVLSSLMI